MGIEIERKFLVDHAKWRQLGKPAGEHYRQGYLTNGDKATVRIRVADSKGYITIKGETSGISRMEFEYEIPFDEGTELLDNFALSEIDKTRYCINVGGKTWEVDEFSGDNEGLITAEIELELADEKFILPDWVTREVSDDPRYYNSSLSQKPFKYWR